ncbi:hypothetical protein B0J14DRAFT_652176 [Halenospora varia]|nr:hypothetical protein B0J14DRAFT_652176 [Halenospora varia]
MARPSRYGGYSSDSEDSDFETAYTSSRSSQPSSASHFSAPSSRSSIPSTSSHRTESSHPSHGSAQSYSSRHSSQHTDQDARRGRLQLVEERAGTVGNIAKTVGGIATASGLAYTVYHSYKKKKDKRLHSKKSNDEKRNHQAFKNTYERQNSEIDLRLKEKGGHQKLWYDRQISEVDLLVKERDLTPDERRRLARRNKVEEPWRLSRGVGGSQVNSRYSAEESPMRQTEDNAARRDHYGEPRSRRSRIQ